MKKILLVMTVIACFLLQACEKKGPGDNYDFSNSLPPYVALSSTEAISVKQGASVPISFVQKTSIQQVVTITYAVTGAVNLTNQTATIVRDALTGTTTVSIPAGIIVAPATSAVATLTLVKAVKADGTVLTLGSTNNASAQKVTINITP